MKKAMIALIAISVFLSGCNTYNGMMAKFDKLYLKSQNHDKTKQVPNDWSIKMFPVKEDTIQSGEPIYIRGNDSIVYEKGETVYIDCDTGKGKVKCPDCPTVKKIYRADTVKLPPVIIRIEDTRKINQLEAKLRQQEQQVAICKAKTEIAERRSRNRLFWCIGEGIGLLLMILLFIAGLTGRLSK